MDARTAALRLGPHAALAQGRGLRHVRGPLRGQALALLADGSAADGPSSFARLEEVATVSVFFSSLR